MKEHINSKRYNKESIVVLIVLANIGIYGLPFMKIAFYDIMIDATQLSHVQMNFLFGIYGVVAMFSYILGGVLSDIISPKKILLSSLILSTVLHTVYYFIPSYNTMILIFALLGISSVMMFFPASTKILSIFYSKKVLGRVFSIYYALVGLVGGFINIFVMKIIKNNPESLDTFKSMLIVYILFNIIPLLLLMIYLPDLKIVSENDEKVEIKYIGKLLGNKRIVLASIVMLSNFLLVDMLTYINPLLKIKYSFSDYNILSLTLFRVYILTTIFGPIYGVLVDKVKSSIKVMNISLILSTILLVFFMLFFKGNNSFIIVLICFVLTVNVTGAKGISLVISSELGISKKYLGTVIGIISFIGYSPDAFFYPYAGILIQNYGLNGYMYIFLTGTIISLSGLFAGIFLNREVKELK